MKTITFVCYANVCRSYAAEKILKGMLKINNMKDVVVNSVGTNDIQMERDGTMKYILSEKGYETEGQRTHMTKDILMKSDLILVMDYNNYMKVTGTIDSPYWDKVHYFMKYCFGIKDAAVVDPSGMCEDEYKKTVRLLEEGCKVIVKRLKEDVDDMVSQNGEGQGNEVHAEVVHNNSNDDSTPFYFY